MTKSFIDKRPNTKYNTILIVNALSGALPLAVRKKYPNSKIVCGEYFQHFKNHLHNLGFEVYDWDKIINSGMKFDAVVGNPPYQDGSQSGGQNKIYNQFSKNALELLNDNGVLAFVTPISVLKKSKRFSLTTTPGLKSVDFTANDHFSDIGVTVCSWIVDKSHNTNVAVKTKTGISYQPQNTAIYDYSVVDKKFTKIYEVLKSITKDPKNRMFKQNPVDASVNGRSKVKTKEHNYPVFKIENNAEMLVQYNKPKPKLYNKEKFVISTSKSFNEESCIVSRNDFDVNHVFVDIDHPAEIDNIKSFLFSEYFISHCNNFKKLDGYGFNNAVKYLPPFDKTILWSNDDVKKFIENLVN